MIFEPPRKSEVSKGFFFFQTSYNNAAFISMADSLFCMPIWNCKTGCYLLYTDFYGYDQCDFAIKAQFPRKFSVMLNIKIKHNSKYSPSNRSS